MLKKSAHMSHNRIRDAMYFVRYLGLFWGEVTQRALAYFVN